MLFPQQIVADFCRENHITVTLSLDMPAGYETAYGTYDVTVNTLFLNTTLLKNAPKHEMLFYLYHELRHALQYLKPQCFDAAIRDSRFYVVLYNGICYRLTENTWQQCTLQGTDDFFLRVYLSLPYELDANAFAYEKTKAHCGDLPALQELYGYYLPEEKCSQAELSAVFDQIDNAISPCRKDSP